MASSSDAAAQLEQPADCASVHDAVVKKDRRAVAWHLQRQPDCVMQRDEDGRTPLLLAAAAGDTTTCTLLVRRMSAHNAEAINWADAGGLTPLHWALTQQQHEAAAVLLRHAASTSVEDEDGRRPLHAAAFSGNARCVSLLLPHVSRDAVSAPSTDRLTPLHYAALSGAAAAATPAGRDRRLLPAALPGALLGALLARRTALAVAPRLRALLRVADGAGRARAHAAHHEHRGGARGRAAPGRGLQVLIDREPLQY